VDLGSFEVIDLTLRLTPGAEERRLEIRPGVIEHDQTYYFDLDTMSHIGTHVEAPMHFYGVGEASGTDDLPLEAFIGTALLLDLSGLADGAGITADALRNAGGEDLEPGQIAVLTARRGTEAAPALTAGAAGFLAESGIKMLALDDSVALGRDTEEIRAVHDVLMSRDVPFLERLTNLDAVPRHFTLVALPWRVAGLDSSPVRAVGLVPRDS
jgi:arylformamidase